MTAPYLPRQRGIETGQSWVIACAALLVLSIAYGALSSRSWPCNRSRRSSALNAPRRRWLFAHLCRLGDRRYRDGVGRRMSRHAPRRKGVRTDDRARYCPCLQRRALSALRLQPGAAGPARRRGDVLADHRLCDAVVRPAARLGRGVISSGQYVAGAVWPVLLQVGIDRYGGAGR